jgi:outer membrane biosynthesis protein TonB
MDEKKAKRKGIIGTVLFHVLLLVALLFLALRTPLPLPGEEGVEVSLGDAVTGSGLTQPEKIKPVQRIEPIVPRPEPKKIIQQEVEEAPALEEEKPEEKKVKEDVEKKPAEEIKKEPKVNPNALYKPHQKDQSESGNQGSGQEQADQGKVTGSKESKKPDGTAGMGDGVSFNLEGRGSVHLPKPAYDTPEQGKVVVTIWVNKQGKVTRALEGAKGTTITSLKLRKLARDAALKAVFTPDPNAPELQKGTITYNFVRIN